MQRGKELMSPYRGTEKTYEIWKEQIREKYGGDESNMSVRRQTVVRNPGTLDCPMIKIANSTLEDMGFEMGTAIEVSYQQNLITIRNITQHEHNNIQTPHPVTNPTSSGRVDATESDGHAGSGARDAEGNPKALRDVSIHSHVQRGYRYACNVPARTGTHSGTVPLEGQGR